jgi:hypothetical protein
MFTPTSAISERSNSEERANFFKFKRQLHKSNICNVSSNDIEISEEASRIPFEMIGTK